MKVWSVRFLATVAFALCSSVFFNVAQGGASGDAYLAKVDKALNRYKTLKLEYTIKTKEPKRKKRIMKVRSRFKGKKQLTELLAPADVKGTKALHLSPTRIYVYLPAYRKVRRVASHATSEGFMGTTYNQVDMNLTRYSRYFTAKVKSETKSELTLILSKRKKKKVPYKKLEMVVDKAYNLPARIRYYDEAGRHIKTETRKDHVCDKGACLPRIQKMVDHGKGGKYSTLELTGYKVNPSLPDSLFSKRNLRP